jgi:hypothetical protein
MTRLILTTDDSGAGSLRAAGIADIVIPFGIRFVWGPQPSDAEFATFLEACSTKPGSRGSHWLESVRPRQLERIGGEDLGLIGPCARCETIEFWVDPDPNAQLTLIWLLDYCSITGLLIVRRPPYAASTRDHSPSRCTRATIVTSDINGAS